MLHEGRPETAAAAAFRKNRPELADASLIELADAAAIEVRSRVAKHLPRWVA